MNFLKPSTDFFGPKASEYRDILEERPDFHLIPHCGEKIVRAIDKLASAIVDSKSQPEWQRRDGSIIFNKLPWQIKHLFDEGDFDEKGYINLDRIHVYAVDTLYGLSNSQRSSGKANYCALPGKMCLKASKYMESVTTCAALTYRLIEGRSFDVRRHTYGIIPSLPVNYHSKLEDSEQLIEAVFNPIWSYARELKAQKESSSLYYICSGVAALFFILFKRPSCLQG